MTLVKSPADLTILEVVNAVEPIQRYQECPLGLAAHGVRLCPLHRRMDQALSLVEEAFRQTTLAEILAEPTESKPLCDFPGRVNLPLQPVSRNKESKPSSRKRPAR